MRTRSRRTRANIHLLQNYLKVHTALTGASLVTVTRKRFTCTCTRHLRHTPLAQVFQLHAGLVWRPIRESVRVENCKRETTSIAMCVAMMRFNQNRSPHMGQINGNCILHSHCYFFSDPPLPQLKVEKTRREKNGTCSLNFVDTYISTLSWGVGNWQRFISRLFVPCMEWVLGTIFQDNRRNTFAKANGCLGQRRNQSPYHLDQTQDFLCGARR